MFSLKLHLKTALLASAVTLVVLFTALLLISVNVANQVRNEQKQLAQLDAENLAEHLSLFPEQIDADDLQRLTNLVSGTRPNLVTVRVWHLENNEFVEKAASDDSLPVEEIPAETRNALRNGTASQVFKSGEARSDESVIRIFAPIVIKNKTDGAIEAVENLDTVSTIAFRYVANLLWIGLATLVLMTVAFYLLFQNLVYQPLENLLSAMDQAKAGNLAAEAAAQKQDEFRRLSGNFNSMMTQIREMTSEREKQTEILQEKVSEATAELKRQNEQLETANLELFRTTRKMSEMERLAAAGQTAAQFAHEVGTPLNLISGHIQLLQTTLTEDEKTSVRLQTINTQIERIEKIVREMLDRTRFGTSEHKPLNLNDLLQKIFDAIEPALEENKVALTTRLAENLPKISGDADRLQQVFLNLVNNALDAMPAGGTLEISTAFNENKVLVEFADSGLGMSEETASKIFQPLFTTKERGQGTGLGLVVVKQILQEHEAEITVASESGKGARFMIYFPAN